VPDLALEHEKLEGRLEQLEREPESYKHVVVFQHIPWFVRHIDKPDDAVVSGNSEPNPLKLTQSIISSSTSSNVFVAVGLSAFPVRVFEPSLRDTISPQRWWSL